MSEINDAAVEAGARAMWAYWGSGIAFDFARANRRNAFMSDARRVLTAALPHLTPAPSATREEVAEMCHSMLPDMHEPLRSKIAEEWASQWPARFNITQKGDDRD